MLGELDMTLVGGFVDNGGRSARLKLQLGAMAVS